MADRIIDMRHALRDRLEDGSVRLDRLDTSLAASNVANGLSRVGGCVKSRGVCGPDPLLYDLSMPFHRAAK